MESWLPQGNPKQFSTGLYMLAHLLKGGYHILEDIKHLA